MRLSDQYLPVLVAKRLIFPENADELRPCEKS
jgi:hypothetical protein